MTRQPSLTEAEIISTFQAVRFGLASVVLGLSYPNIQCALGLDTYRLFFRELLGEKPLPATTLFILQAQPFLIAFSMLIPLLAIIMIFVRWHPRSIYIFGLLILTVFSQLFFTWQAISAALFSVLSTLQAV